MRNAPTHGRTDQAFEAHEFEARLKKDDRDTKKKADQRGEGRLDSERLQEVRRKAENQYKNDTQ